MRDAAVTLIIFGALFFAIKRPWVGVLVYVMVGGMVAVAWTDFVQMIVLVIGLAFIAVMAGEQAGWIGAPGELAIEAEGVTIVAPADEAEEDAEEGEAAPAAAAAETEDEA